MPEGFAVVVIGAGPAGLYAARALVDAGMQVALLNRDIKPGGLAEYGIFHNKHKMKNGLRKKFRKVMDIENIRYYGNVMVSEDGDLNLNALRDMGFKAIVVAVGAQKTKWLGIEGEDLSGVYHAKDLVYHYNQLPPFSEQPYPIGKKVVLIGAGNVMVDIAHYCIRDLKVEQVTAVVRRGPADVKFTKKEMSLVYENLDLATLDAEIERTRPILQAADQDPDAAREFIMSGAKKAQAAVSNTRFDFAFLASPNKMVGENGALTGLLVDETTLELRDGGRTSAVMTGEQRIIPADTVVFCIGDRVDPILGLPLNKWQEFAVAPQPRYPVNDISYEAYDPEMDTIIKDVFLTGWAREASSGLVGTARKDGEDGAAAALQYLESASADDAEDAFAALDAHLQALDKRIVDKVDWKKLDEHEQAQATKAGLEMVKYSSNAEMLTIIDS